MLTEQFFDEIMEIGIVLTAEKNNTKLMELILDKAIEVSHCDGGTLYLYENGYLHFNIMRTLSKGIYQGGTLGKVELPPVALCEENVCAYAAIRKCVINIEDVNDSDQFDFFGPKRYDLLINYNTKSIMVVPLLNQEDELIGVLQLINALDKDDHITSFDSSFERIILFLASQAAVAISNVRYIKEIKDLLQSFAAAMGTAVDARTPYNGNHTRKVTELISEFTLYLDRLYLAGSYHEPYDEERREQLRLAASLHDIGKMAIPLHVMDKETRLGKDLELLETRFELFTVWYERDLLIERIGKDTYNREIAYLDEALELVRRVNTMGSLTDDLTGHIETLKQKYYLKTDGTKVHYLSGYQAECLSIRTGTLTRQERLIMESHVTMTSQILENIQFKSSYLLVPDIAAKHHELLDGSGYPSRLGADEISTDVRILTIIDVYDALTSMDRPYKNPIPATEALDILDNLAAGGKLDRILVTYFRDFIRRSEAFAGKAGLARRCS